MTRFTSSDLAMMQRRLSGRPKFVIGIDPGRTTGYAFVSHGKLVACESDIPIRIEKKVLTVSMAAGSDLLVVVEDTRNFRLPKALQTAGKEKGVGAVFAEMHRWEEFCQHYDIPYKMQAPSKHIKRKTTAEDFKRDFPDFKGRTNHNARDAAYLAAYFG